MYVIKVCSLFKTEKQGNVLTIISVLQYLPIIAQYMPSNNEALQTDKGNLLHMTKERILHYHGKLAVFHAPLLFFKCKCV